MFRCYYGIAWYRLFWIKATVNDRATFRSFAFLDSTAFLLVKVINILTAFCYLNTMLERVVLLTKHWLLCPHDSTRGSSDFLRFDLPVERSKRSPSICGIDTVFMVLRFKYDT